jgi:hypothetical protein
MTTIIVVKREDSFNNLNQANISESTRALVNKITSIQRLTRNLEAEITQLIKDATFNRHKTSEDNEYIKKAKKLFLALQTPIISLSNTGSTRVKKKSIQIINQEVEPQVNSQSIVGPVKKEVSFEQATASAPRVKEEHPSRQNSVPKIHSIATFTIKSKKPAVQISRFSFQAHQTSKKRSCCERSWTFISGDLGLMNIGASAAVILTATYASSFFALVFGGSYIGLKTFARCLWR